MNPTLTAEEIERIARKRAGAKLGWYAHAAVYLTVNTVMFIVTSQGLGNHPWSMKPVLGWGLGLLFHGIAVFVLGAGSSLRERMVQKERERLQRQQQER